MRKVSGSFFFSNFLTKRIVVICTTLFVLCFASKSFAQQLPPTDKVTNNRPSTKAIDTIHIKVIDIEDGTPIENANVIVGFKSAVSNSNGQIIFEKVTIGASIVVTKAGYYTFSRKVKGNMMVRMIRLDKNTGVATINNGIYERPTEHFSGAATVISGDALRKISPLSIIDALGYFDPAFIATKDNLNGDNPNNHSAYRIRGRYDFPASATIASPNNTVQQGVQINPSSADYVADNVGNPDQPIVLLDGAQVSLQTIIDMDINLVDKVTLLKDAAATAVYGVRGGNGMLLIQTKLPQKGSPRISYSGQVQIATADLSSYNLMDANQKLQFEQSAGLYASNPTLYQSRYYQANHNSVNTNWLKIPLQTAVSNKHTLNLETGDDDTRYGLTFSYNDATGVMKGSGRKTANFGAFISSHFKNFFFSNHLTYQKADGTNSPYGSFSDFEKQNPYWNPYDTVTGQITKIMEQYSVPGKTVNTYNPAVNGILSTANKTAYYHLANYTTINLIVGRGFDIIGIFAIGKQSDQNDFFLPPGHTLYADYAPVDFIKRGLYNQSQSSFVNMEGRLSVNYNKKIGMHQFYGTAGAAAVNTKSEAEGISLVGFTSDRLADITFGNAYSNTRPTAGQINSRLASSFANFTYSYDNRYQVEVSGNADMSSQFGKNYQYAPHWAGAVSWNLHQEHFFHANKILDQLKIRASIGNVGTLSYQSYLGNTAYNYYTDRQYISGGSNLGTRGIGLGAYMTGLANDEQQAPQIQKMNAGIDAVLFNNKVSVRADAFYQQSKNLVLPIVSPTSTGLFNYSYYDNLGAIESRGVEFAVNAVLLQNKKKGITWNVMLNGIHTQDKIKTTSGYLDAINNANDAMTVDQTRPQPRYVAGQSLTGIWAVKSLGIDPATGKEKFLKADGSTTFLWNAADKIFAGDMNPDLQGSFGTSLMVKQFSATLYFTYQFGAYQYNQTLADKIENADVNYNVDARAAANRWKQAGDVALYKAISVNGMISDPTYATTRFVEKNNFINCSAVSLGYALPVVVAHKIRAQQVNFRLIGENLFSTGKNNAERGIYYPFQRRYSLSINTTF